MCCLFYSYLNTRLSILLLRVFVPKRFLLRDGVLHSTSRDWVGVGVGSWDIGRNFPVNNKGISRGNYLLFKGFQFFSQYKYTNSWCLRSTTKRSSIESHLQKTYLHQPYNLSGDVSWRRETLVLLHRIIRSRRRERESTT